MISRLYSIHDRAVGAYGTPILQVNDVMARRNLSEFLLSDQTSDLFKYADSYDLYYIGDFDTSNGVVSPVVPSLVARVVDLKVAS